MSIRKAGLLNGVLLGLLVAAPPTRAECNYREHSCVFTPVEHFGDWGNDIKIVASAALVGEPDTAAVQVLAFDGLEWQYQQTLSSSTAVIGFGDSLDMSADGTVAVIGSPQENSSDGAAYVFERDGRGVWSELQRIVPPGANNFWGSRVCISDSSEVIVVGSSFSSNWDGVHVYRKGLSQWDHETLLTPSGSIYENGGVDISGDGTTIAMGAWQHNGERGIAYTFQYDGTIWIEAGTLEPVGLEVGDHFGGFVEFQGNAQLLMRTPSMVYVCDMDEFGDWSAQDELPADSGYEFRKCAVDGTAMEMVISANSDDDAAVFAFTWDGSNWIQNEKIVIDPDVFDDFFAIHISIDGALTLVGYNNWKLRSFQCDVVPCDGDANRDRVVDPLDVGYVSARFGCLVGWCDLRCDIADLNDDGIVDPLDVGYIMARFGSCP